VVNVQKENSCKKGVAFQIKNICCVVFKR